MQLQLVKPERTLEDANSLLTCWASSLMCAMSSSLTSVPMDTCADSFSGSSTCTGLRMKRKKGISY